MIIPMDRPFANDHLDGPAFLKKSSPNIFLIFLLCFSSPPEKDILLLLIFSSFFISVFLLLSDRTSSFPKPKPGLFFETKISETDIFFRDQILRNRDPQKSRNGEV